MLYIRKWSSTLSSFSHVCLPTLLIFKLLVTLMEGTLNTDLVSVNPQQNVLPTGTLIFFISCLVYSEKGAPSLFSRL